MWAKERHMSCQTKANLLKCNKIRLLSYGNRTPERMRNISIRQYISPLKLIKHIMESSNVKYIDKT